MEYLIIALSQFAAIAGKAFQQQNVTHKDWVKIPPTSYYLYGFELASYGFAITTIVNDPSFSTILLTWLCGGTGGWIGTFFAIRLHCWLNEKKRRG